MQLTGGRRFFLSMSLTIDHQTAGPANTFSTVVIEFNWNLIIFDEVFVNDVEHLKKGHVFADAVSCVGFEVAWVA